MFLVRSFAVVLLCGAVARAAEPAVAEDPLLAWTSSVPLRVPCLRSPEVRAFLDQESKVSFMADRLLFRQFADEPCPGAETVTLYLLSFACPYVTAAHYCLTERVVQAAMERNLFKPAALRDYLAYARLDDPEKPEDRVTLGSYSRAAPIRPGGPPRVVRVNAMVADWTHPITSANEVYFLDGSLFLARRRFPHEP